jgi:hypothetical protein
MAPARVHASIDLDGLRAVDGVTPRIGGLAVRAPATALGFPILAAAPPSTDACSNATLLVADGASPGPPGQVPRHGGLGEADAAPDDDDDSPMQQGRSSSMMAAARAASLRDDDVDDDIEDTRADAVAASGHSLAHS